MNKLILFSALLVGVPSLIVAQESGVDRNVTVEREFQPVIEDAGKLTTLPEILEPSASRQRVDYADLFHPLPLGRYLQSLPMTAYQAAKPKRQEAFVRLGMGNYWNTLGELTLPVLKKEKDRLDLNVDHLGTFGKRKFSQTNAGIDFNHLFKTTELFVSAGISHRFFNYYGTGFTLTGNPVLLDTLTGSVPDETQLIYRAQLGFRSMPDQLKFRHKGMINYEGLNSAADWNEQIVNVEYGFSNLLKKNRYGVDFELKNMTYQAPSGTTGVQPDYSVLTLNPYYLIERERTSLRLGFTTAFSFVTGRTFNPSPDIHAEWKVIPKLMALYGGVGGDFTVMTYSKLRDENPWVVQSLRVKDTYTPFKPYLGLKVKPVHFLMLEGFAEYNSIRDQYFFVNDTISVAGLVTPLLGNRFDVEYSDASLFRYGGRIAFQYKNRIGSGLKLVVNKWTTEQIAQAWMKPGLEADWNLDVKVNPNLTISSTFIYEGRRYARLGSLVHELNPVTDLNLSASYFFNTTFSAFVKLNNILNRDYQQVVGYDVQKFNFLLGGAVSF